MKASIWMHFAVIGVIACSDSDEPVTKKPSSSLVVLDEGYPVISHGASSADVILKSKEAGRVSVLLTASREDAEDVNDLFTNTVAILKLDTALNAGQEISIPAKNLKEGTRHFLYVADSRDGIPSKILKQEEFTTKIRQDTSHFWSDAEKREVDYLIYRPESVFKNPDGKYPIIFSLGGLGERGSQERPINLIQNGLLPEYIWNGNDVLMMVMSVQHIHSDWNNDLINEAISFALETFPIDTKRLYLVGTSAGAYGAWRFAEEHATRITAMAAFSGGGDREKACKLKDLPVYAFHNQVDPLVSAKESVDMVSAVNNCSPREEALLQIFPDEGHDCWRRVFDHNHPDWSKSPNVPKVDIFKWLLEHQRTTTN